MEPHMAAQRNQNFLFATTEGHSSDIGTTEFWGSHLGPQQQRLNGAPSKLSPFLSLGWARGTGMSMAHTTAHALPSGDGEKVKIGHPTNDPRPSFRRTRKHNSIANPPFTRKENLSLVSSGGARGDQDEPGSHTTTTHTAPRTWRAKGELFTYASRDEHGQHYRSCATEWGWREDENRPP